MRDFFIGWEMLLYSHARYSFFDAVMTKAQSYWRFFVGPLLTTPLLTVPWLWLDGRARPLLLAALLLFAGLACETFHNLHYAGSRYSGVFRNYRSGFRAPAYLEFSEHARWLGIREDTAVACILALAVRAATATADTQTNWNWRFPGNLKRAHILSAHMKSNGKHSVLVRYNASHESGDEWVYNEADIDRAKVVWAREMDFTSNASLIRYLQTRQVWLVQPDVAPSVLVPFRESYQPFPFVQLGTDAIEILRSPERVKQKVIENIAASGYREPYRFTCDQWNFFF